MEFLVDLNTVENTKEFVRLASKYDCDIIVKNSGRAFAVDGSSILGVFSLNLMEPVEVHIEDIRCGELFKNDVQKFLIIEDN